MGLARFAEEARARVKAGYYAVHDLGLERRDFASAIEHGRGVVAEIKPATPTHGVLRAGVDVPTLARGFEKEGAAALSVLTVPEGFGGSLRALEEAVRATRKPVLMKDFIVSEEQIRAAAATGASAVLLIPDLVAPDALDRFIATAHDLDLDVLLEAYDEAGFAAAMETEADVLAVNNRDLRRSDLPVDPTTFARVLDAEPKDRPTMSLSGLRTRRDVIAQFEAGADAVLVGTEIMRSPDPMAALRGLIS